LAQRAPRLLANLPATFGPRFFFASLTRCAWAPRVVVVKRAEEIEGIVYVKERKLVGLETGMIFGDSALGTMVVAAPGLGEVVLERALDFLLDQARIRSVRLLVPPTGPERAILERVAARRHAEFLHREEFHHHVVPLAGSYDGFLKSLTFKARRNVRYYRRRYEAAGHHYIAHMDLAEFRRVAASLLDRGVTGGIREAVTRALDMFSHADSPLLAGLRRRDGEWVAILGGWSEGDRPIVFFQLNNDRDYKADSLSVVLRACFI
jgi:hypothetical protein